MQISLKIPRIPHARRSSETASQEMSSTLKPQNLNQTPLLQGVLSVEKIFSLATWEERYEKSRSWRQIQIMNNLDPEKTFI